MGTANLALAAVCLAAAGRAAGSSAAPNPPTPTATLDALQAAPKGR